MGRARVIYYYSWPSPVETLIELRSRVRFNRGGRVPGETRLKIRPSPTKRFPAFSAPPVLQTYPILIWRPRFSYFVAVRFPQTPPPWPRSEDGAS